MAHTDKKSFEYIWKSMLAGGLAGLAAKTAIAPLDRVKILFQTQHPAFTSHSGSFMGGIAAIRQISSTQGVAGLFQGHSATVLRIVPYAAVKFMAYEQCKMFLMPQPSDESPARRFLAGAFAGSQFNQGCTSVFVSYPFDLLRVRMAFEAKASLWQTLSMVYHEPNRLWPHPSRSLAPLASLGNLYRGFMPTIYGMVPTYETAKQYAMQQAACTNAAGDKLKPWVYLLCGAISGMIAQTSSYPLEVIRRRMQVAGRTDPLNQYATTYQTAKTILATKGIRGLYVGLGIGYIKVTPMVAVSFFSYEYLKMLLGIA